MGQEVYVVELINLESGNSCIVKIFNDESSANIFIDDIKPPMLSNVSIKYRVLKYNLQY